MVNPSMNNFLNTFGGMASLMQQFNSFKNGLPGNPSTYNQQCQQQVQNMLNSGQMNQNQFQQVFQLAQQLSQMMPR